MLGWLRRHKTRQLQGRLLAGQLWQDHDLVFCTGLGKPLDDTVVRRAFQHLCKKAAIPRVRLHDLRHTMATLMLARGVHTKIVSERLGHASVSITLDVYSHVPPNLQGEAAAALDAWLTQPRKAAKEAWRDQWFAKGLQSGPQYADDRP